MSRFAWTPITREEADNLHFSHAQGTLLHNKAICVVNTQVQSIFINDKKRYNNEIVRGKTFGVLKYARPFIPSGVVARLESGAEVTIIRLSDNGFTKSRGMYMHTGNSHPGSWFFVMGPAVTK